MTVTRETIELAALAIGGTFSPGTTKKRVGATWDEWEWRGPIGITVGGIVMHPHTDIGDAAKVAVKLRLVIYPCYTLVKAMGLPPVFHDDTQSDAERAYCEAVTLCAADIGRKMKEHQA